MVDDLARARAIAAQIPDPEIPVITISDLGILRDVRSEEGTLIVSIIPTYSGCPAMDVISSDIRAALEGAGFTKTRVETLMSPAWSTDLMSDEGRQKLKEFGIAPPQDNALAPPCPLCGSDQTEKLSQFGSTACKALWRCTSCREPFDYFKCL